MITFAGDIPVGEEIAKVIALPVMEGATPTFESTFRSLFPRATRVARRILNDEGLAEDAAAEAFARAHSLWRKIGSSEFRDAWILRVTANVAIDMGRRRRRFLLAGLAPRAAVERASTEAVDPGLSDLARALAALPRRQREIVVLRYLDGIPEAEVASALGVSLGTVKKEAFVARRALRERLGTAFEA